MTDVPPAIAALLDGSELSRKIGVTLLVIAAGEGGEPHVAMLSPGEALVDGPRTFRLALYGASGTSRALADSGGGLLHAVVEGVVYRVWFSCRTLAEEGGLIAFSAEVKRTAVDEVGYARVRHGIEYDLVDPELVLARWGRQLEWLAGPTKS